MPKLKVNDIEVEVEKGASILQACEQVGVEVPRFCYHDRLSVPANCRMCLVEVKGAPKPVASCAMAAGDDMEVFTSSEKVKKARNGVMEMLLINHPLDCPICDQGGECDLQDQAMGYGFDRSRFAENKRAVSDKYLGPLVKTIMTRCIHCTRCVRFADEIAGVPEMGMTGRGEHSEIGPYLETAISSELSGNLVDVCPVGALTSKPYEFNARPWELKKTHTIDVMDAVGSNIRMDARGSEVLRVQPRLHEDVNEEWISDKTRHACHGLKKRRLDRPYVRTDGKLQPVSWEEAFEAVAAGLKGMSGDQIAAVAGDQADAESIFMLKELMAALGSEHLECRQDGARFDAHEPSGYVFNSTIAGIEDADLVLMIGANPRHEATMVNARIRKRYLQGGLTIGVVGENTDLTYPYEYLGAGPQTVAALLDGSGEFAAKLKAAERPLVILGMGALQRADGMAMQAQLAKLADTYNLVRDGWNGVNLLHTAAARVGALQLGFAPKDKARALSELMGDVSTGKIKAVYLLDADELPLEPLDNAFVVYQGHHGDKAAAKADVILPGAAYSEKHGIYMNMEGRVQSTRRAVFPPGEAREDWSILRALSAVLGQTLPYDSQGAVRQAMFEAYPAFASLDQPLEVEAKAFGADGKVDEAPFVGAVQNYYQTCAISRASEVMQACVDEIVNGQSPEDMRAQAQRTGTDG
ncbi:MAG: NADH-quinone oxidoreductase subunit NuoG [Alphaproteobacteria bacterium]|nr:NADH-quinone oxidoreductase subunit NuoG [Alphaproteobacteria bacterium SS10]